MKKRLVAILLTVVMLLSLFPVTAGATGGANGKIGQEITWNFSDGVLSVSGKGEMYDYDWDWANLDWENSEIDNIMTIRISDGVTCIGQYCFVGVISGLHAKNIVIPSSVTRIKYMAFRYGGYNELPTIYYGGSKTQWDNIQIDYSNGSNDVLRKAKIVYNSDGSEIPSRNGWLQVENKWYYFENGVRAMNWKTVDGTWYYFNSSGVMQTGWLNDGGTWYYLSDSGSMTTGWTSVDDTWYYMNGSGAMQTGWLNDGAWYYLNSSGSMATGWTSVDGTWYYMSSSGAMQTGWLNDNGTWYYLYDSGSMATGWLNLSGTWYYLSGSGSMLTGTQTIDGTTYTFDGSGAWIG